MNGKEKLLLPSLAVGVLLFSSLTVAAGTDRSMNAKLQATLDTCRVQSHVPAMELSVSLPGEYTPRDFVSGTTKQNGKSKVTPGSLFQIGSITKSFTSAIILQLEAEGKLNIDDPLSKYIIFSNVTMPGKPYVPYLVFQIRLKRFVWHCLIWHLIAFL